jgi:hypothetical protein
MYLLPMGISIAESISTNIPIRIGQSFAQALIQINVCRFQLVLLVRQVEDRSCEHIISI